MFLCTYLCSSEARGIFFTNASLQSPLVTGLGYFIATTLVQQVMAKMVERVGIRVWFPVRSRLWLQKTVVQLCGHLNIWGSGVLFSGTAWTLKQTNMANTKKIHAPSTLVRWYLIAHPFPGQNAPIRSKLRLQYIPPALGGVYVELVTPETLKNSRSLRLQGTNVEAPTKYLPHILGIFPKVVAVSWWF